MLLKQVNEERATVLASRTHIERSFGATKMADLRAYAWPLSENTFVTWHEVLVYMCYVCYVCVLMLYVCLALAPQREYLRHVA